MSNTSTIVVCLGHDRRDDLPLDALQARAHLTQLIENGLLPWEGLQDARLTRAVRYSIGTTFGSYEHEDGTVVQEHGTVWIGTYPTAGLPALYKRLAKLASALGQESIGLIVQNNTDTLVYAHPNIAH